MDGGRYTKMWPIEKLDEPNMAREKFHLEPGKKGKDGEKKDPKLATSCLLKLLMQFVSSGNKPKKNSKQRKES